MNGELIALLEYWEKEKGISKDHYGFQMLSDVQVKQQEYLRKQGHEVCKHITYGTDWLPYLLNRLMERRENVLFALQVLRGEK